ncbi:MAG: choice-of-anchor tandem repeat GloVer-containing protein [Rhizomicrobium sp.]
MRVSPRIYVIVQSIVAIVFLAIVPGHAATFNVIYDFCAKASCTDGGTPLSEIFVDAAGHLFGTTAAGGTANGGTFYELTRDTQTGKWKRTTLYNFCSKANCTDGSSPLGRLIADASGNFYGVVYSNGAEGGNGVAYELSPGVRGKWKSKTLYTFCSKAQCTDGFGMAGGLTYKGVQSGLAYDGKSPLYGATRFGGSVGQGIVYALTPARGTWTESIIHDFCTETESCDLHDGSNPAGELVIDADGNLFGATEGGGPNFGGTLFQLSPDGANWDETILHSFCDQTGCEEGNMPTGVVMNAAGDLLGSTQQSIGQEGTSGVTFKLAPNGDYSVSHKFCSLADCADGMQPLSNVSIDAAGNLFGTAVSGGGNDGDPNHGGGGVLFRITAAGKFKVLHSFCAMANCADGAYPETSAVAGADGHLYGTTTIGGKFGKGVVYEIVP